MLSKEEFIGLCERVSSRSKELLKKKGKHDHLAIVGKGYDLYLLTPVGDGADIAREVGKVAPRIGAEFVILVSEAWRSSATSSLPSESSDREEILLVSAEHIKHGVEMVHYKMERNAKGKVTKLIKRIPEFDTVKGRLTHLLGGNGDTHYKHKPKLRPGFKSHFRMPGITLH